MNIDEAKVFLKDMIEHKARWGRMSVAVDNSTIDRLLEAVEVVVMDDSPTVSKEEHTTVQRQLTASKAREAKLKKQIEKLTDQG